MIGIWASMAVALAGWSVEGPSEASRADAATAAKATKEVGYKGRIVRRFREGRGWEYLVRIEGLDDETEARAAAEVFSKAVNAPVTLLDGDGKSVGTVSPAAPEPPEPADEGTEPEVEQDGVQWVDKVSESHGDARAALSDASTVVLVYEKILPDGRKIQHTYARRGTDLYLDISSADKGVKGSTTLALADKAWLTVAGKSSEEDLQRARETIAKFGPAAIMPIVLDVEGAAEEHPILAQLRPISKEDVGGPCVVFAQRPDGGPSVAIGEGDALIHRVVLEDGKRHVRFSDYETLGDVQIPHRIETLKSGEEAAAIVVISRLELDSEIESDWFEHP